jgi:hypothetical protein
MTTLHFDEQHAIIWVKPDLFPYQEEFELWATVFLHHDALTWLEMHTGADRCQVRFRFQDESFNLNYDYYSDSIWITPEGIEAEALLLQLHKIF